jgi:hypothetical protein
MTMPAKVIAHKYPIAIVPSQQQFCLRWFLVEGAFDLDAVLVFRTGVAATMRAIPDVNPKPMIFIGPLQPDKEGVFGGQYEWSPQRQSDTFQYLLKECGL